MKVHEVVNEMRKFIEMNEDDFIQKLFHDEEFMVRYVELEQQYHKLLVKNGKRLGRLRLAPICQEHYNNVVLVTPSARKKGEWQRTIFLRSEPISHKEYESLEDVISDNASEWFRHGIWIKEEEVSR